MEAKLSLTVVAERVAAAGNEDGVREQVVADGAQQLGRNDRLGHLGRRRFRLERRPLLLLVPVRLAVVGGHQNTISTHHFRSMKEHSATPTILRQQCTHSKRSVVSELSLG